MNIASLIDSFARKRHTYKPYAKAYKALLNGDQSYSMKHQEVYYESEYLPMTIRSSVQAYANNKDIAIALYKDLISYLKDNGVPVPTVDFPPIPVSNTFERLMFIAKYLQDEEHRIADLPDILWVSSRTIEEDLARLRGDTDPIQICGRRFFIPDTERRNGRVNFVSTAHPLFLAENLTQVLVMLKGLKAMSADPLYRQYALQTGQEIWEQLSPYAKKRIGFVLSELLPEDLAWYKALEKPKESEWFHTEEACSTVGNIGPAVILDCLKNGKPFCLEYDDGGEIRIYTDCRIEPGTFRPDGGQLTVTCSAGRKELQVSQIIRSAYTAEELAAN